MSNAEETNSGGNENQTDIFINAARIARHSLPSRLSNTQKKTARDLMAALHGLIGADNGSASANNKSETHTTKEAIARAEKAEKITEAEKERADWAIREMGKKNAEIATLKADLKASNQFIEKAKVGYQRLKRVNKAIDGLLKMQDTRAVFGIPMKILKKLSVDQLKKIRNRVATALHPDMFNDVDDADVTAAVNKLFKEQFRQVDNLKKVAEEKERRRNAREGRRR